MTAAPRTTLMPRGAGHLARLAVLLPGLALVVVLAVAARAFTLVLPKIISEVTVGIALGLLVANVRRPVK